MGHGRYGHQAMEPACSAMIDAYGGPLQAGRFSDVWLEDRPSSDALSRDFPCAELSLMVGLFKHEQSY